MMISKHEQHHKKKGDETGPELLSIEFAKYVELEKVEIKFIKPPKRSNFHLEFDEEEWVFERLKRYNTDFKMEGTDELLIKFEMYHKVDGGNNNGTFIIFIKSAKIHRFESD